MKKCAFCGLPVIGKQKTARYCSVLCRIKSYRVRKGISEPFEKKGAKIGLKTKNEDTKSFTCCEQGKFYSPVGKWGEVLICDSCGATWVRK